MNTLHIWTDGACKGNPGVGGWGAHLIWGTQALDLYGGMRGVTNNQMELLAVIEALRAIRRPCHIVMHVDSQYVKNGITQWIYAWKLQDWKTQQKQPVKNAELWQELDRLVRKFKITWESVKGHSGDPGNERADQLANWGCEVARGIRSPQQVR